MTTPTMKVIAILLLVLAASGCSMDRRSSSDGRCSERQAAASRPAPAHLKERRSDEGYPELVTEYYDDGLLKSVYFERGGTKHGPTMTFYRSGHPIVVGRYVDGVRHGEWMRYWDGRRLMAQGRFNMGKPTGLHESWDEYGNLRTQEFSYSEDGANVDVAFLWWENGQLEEVRRSMDGVEVGREIRWNEDGSLARERVRDSEGKIINTKEYDIGGSDDD